MPGWYTHMEVAKQVALKLQEMKDGFQGSKLQPADIAAIIRQYPNFYALGAIGPDIFFFLPDFKWAMGNLRIGNFIAQLAEWVIKLYERLDQSVIGPWEDAMGPIEEDTAEEASRLTGDLSNTFSTIANGASAIITTALEDFVSRLYDWFSVFGSGVGEGYDDKLFYWSDMFHYRLTYEFGRDLFRRATTMNYTDSGKMAGTYNPGVAFALGWMTHLAADTTGHAFVNEKVGGPYRVHWQRHHLVENHIDGYVYNDQNGSNPRYNMLTNSAMHFWIQFDNDKKHLDPFGYQLPDFDYFQPTSTTPVSDYSPPGRTMQPFPAYPTGQTLRENYVRRKIFDVDSDIPVSLSQFIRDTMWDTFVNNHTRDNNGQMETHPIILMALTHDPTGRPTKDLMHTTYKLLYTFLKYTSTDYYKMPRPQPPSVFPNLNPPIPPSPDTPPGASDPAQSIWDILLAILSFILYLCEWIAYIATLIPAILADLATLPVREALYPVEEALYELWKALRYLLVLEGFVWPEPDEIDLGLVQIGTPSQGPFISLLGTLNDIFGGLLGDNPNPPPPSDPVHDQEYPRQVVRDDPTLIAKIVQEISVMTATCTLQPPKDSRLPSEFLRPWEYPLLNNAQKPVDLEPPHTIASPYSTGMFPTVFFDGSMPGSDDARQRYEEAPDPTSTDSLNEMLNPDWNLGNPIDYSLYIIKKLVTAASALDSPDMPPVPNFNLDSDRGYGYKCWDWDRHDKYVGRYNQDTNFEYQLPCTPPEQFNKFDICGTHTPDYIPLDYDPTIPLKLHYLAKTSAKYPGCIDDEFVNLPSVPAGFLWGVATSSYQVEGKIEQNDWNFFMSNQDIVSRVNALAALAGQTINLEPAGDADQHYIPDVFQADLARAKALGVNAYRLSLEWSKIEPQPGTFNDYIQYYKTILGMIFQAGMTPLVTINHFTLPLWVLTPPVNLVGEDAGFQRSQGWENPDTVDAYLEFLRHVVKNLMTIEVTDTRGQKQQYTVRYWMTLNEPVGSMVGAGYLAGIWPPGFGPLNFVIDPLGTAERAKKAYLHLLKAHMKGYEAIKEIYGDQKCFVGFAHAMMYPKYTSGFIGQQDLNLQAQSQFDYFYNYHFLDAATSGQVDVNFDANNPQMQNAAQLFGLSARDWTPHLDFVGVNYYRSVYVYWSPLMAFAPFTGGIFDPDLSQKTNHKLLNSMGWEIFPEGLYLILQNIKQKYGIPALITENGIPVPENSNIASLSAADKNKLKAFSVALNDEPRAPFLVAHVQQVLRAIRDGVDVMGYVHWSLLDNWELHEGYIDYKVPPPPGVFSSRFGLFAVDRKSVDPTVIPPTFPRYPTRGSNAYQCIITRGTVDKEVLDAFGAITPDGSQKPTTLPQKNTVEWTKCLSGHGEPQ